MSCGYGRQILFANRNRLPTNHVFVLNSFRKGPAGPFNQVSTVPDANSNTCVLNVVENTRAASAQLRGQKVDSLSVQKANEIVHRVLHSKPVTPVRVDRLDFLLHGYDRFLKQFLVDGFGFGFRIHFVRERFSSESPNLKSTLDQPVVTYAKLRKECDAGRIVGPFTALPFPNSRCSPLGIVPKKDYLNFDEYTIYLTPRDLP